MGEAVRGTIARRRCPVVVGREGVLREAGAALAAAAGGHGGCLALVGDEGVGKSRVLDEIAAAGREAGLAVLAGRAVPPGRSSPYRPLSEALSGLLRGLGPSDPAHLAPFIPALAGIVPRWPSPDGRVRPPLAVAEAALRLVTAIAPQGALLLVEDLHWGDLETLAAVEFLADNARLERLLVVVTARPDESRPLDEVLRSLDARGAVAVHPLAPLGRTGVHEMARACLEGGVSPALVDLLADRSDGVPLLVEDLLSRWRGQGVVAERDGGWEVVRWPGGDVPEWCAGVVRDRLAGLDGAGRAALGSAAVLGRCFAWRTAAAVAGVDEPEMGRVVDAAVAARLVEEDPDAGSPRRHRFRRALTREALLAALSPFERRRLSRAALERVRATGPAVGDDEALADLAEGAEEPDLAARHLLAAGRRHHRGGTLAQAEVVLVRGLGIGDDPALNAELATELVEVLALAGRAGRVLEAGDTWHAAVEPVSPALHARLHLALAQAAQAQGRWDLAWRNLDEARSLAPDEGLARRADVAAIATALRQGGDPRRRALTVRPMREGAPPEEDCEALEVLGSCARSHDLAEAEWLFTRMHDLAEARSLASWRVRSLLDLTLIDVFRLRSPEHLDEAREAAVRIGDLGTALILRFLDALRHYQAFELAECEERIGCVVAAATRNGLVPLAAAGRHLLAACRVHHGSRAEADEPGGDLSPMVGDGLGRSFLRALGALLDEEHGEARSWLDRAVAAAGAGSGPRRARWCGEWGLWALMHALRGDARPVRRLRDRAMTEHRVNAGLASWCDAVLAGAAGRGEEAAGHAATAMSLLEPAPWYDAIGRRLVTETAALAGWGDLGWLGPAVTFFEGAGQVRVADACRARLRHAGRRPAPRTRGARPRSAPFGLSARELEVLRLVEDGLSNRAIAARLSISHRTVEKHIERLLAKTEARNRAQLGAIAALRFHAPEVEVERREQERPTVLELQGRRTPALRVVAEDR